MYHNKKGRKLGRRPDHRKAMMRNLAASLIHEERIETTVTRAKELRSIVERLVTYAKRGDLHGRRLITRSLGNKPEVAAKLLEDIAPRYEKRQGGYTRVLKTGFRRGDAAPTALIELVEEELPQRKRRSKPKTAAPKAAAADEPEEEPASGESDETEEEAGTAEQSGEETADPEAEQSEGEGEEE